MAKSKQNTWPVLNAKIQNMDDEKELEKIMNAEIAGECRLQFVLRIHSRLNKVRAARERQNLIDKVFVMKCRGKGLR